MAIKKQQKRSIDEVKSVPAQNGGANKKAQKLAKKIKLEKPAQVKTEKTVQEAVKKVKAEKPEQVPAAQSNGVQGKKAAKAQKHNKLAEQPQKVKKEIPAEKLAEIQAAKRLKNAEKIKKKNANRAEARKEHGQNKFDHMNLTPAAIEIRIKDIESRPELTKTAKRRLIVLRKKLQIAQGTFVPKPKPVDDGPKLSKTEKRKLRKKQEAAKRLAQGETSEVKPQAVAKVNKKGAVVAKVEAVKQEKNAKVAAKKPQQLKPKEAKKIVLKKEEPEDSEEEDDEEEEEEEDDSDDEADVSNGTLNTTEEQDDDDDEEDDEEDEEDDEDDEEDEEEEEEDEEEEEEVKVPVKKAKKEQEKKQPAAKESKKQPEQNGDAAKKKRFVLFVGNLPYTATAEDIKKHFLTKVSTITDVRVPNNPGTNSPRGFAYVEVSNQTDYEKGLSLQGSILSGRRLKVEYTQGGSKSAGNRQDVISKNKKLHAMRKQGMLAGSQKDGHKRNDRRQKQRQQGPA